MLEEDLNLEFSNCKVCQLKHLGLMYSCSAFFVGGVGKMLIVVEEIVLKCDRAALPHSANLLACASSLN